MICKNKIRLFLSAFFFVLGSALSISNAGNFKDIQLKYPRVKSAIKEKEKPLRNLFKKKGVVYPPQKIFIRIFKAERIRETEGILEAEGVLEIWVKDGARYRLLKEYEICSLSGELGPKRRHLDRQVPEGFYHINNFNPNSGYYLGLQVNYPNESDLILAKKPRGGDIVIHGGCKSDGCLAMTDDAIKEIYLLAVEARSNGQTEIPVHIFPLRFNEEGIKLLNDLYNDNNKLLDFWINLKEGYDFFERTHKLPTVSVDSRGQYIFR